jgi:hypothetical protein
MRRHHAYYIIGKCVCQTRHPQWCNKDGMTTIRSCISHLLRRCSVWLSYTTDYFAVEGKGLVAYEFWFDMGVFCTDSVGLRNHK